MHAACRVQHASCIILGILIHTIYIYNRVIYDVIHEHDPPTRPRPIDGSMDRWGSMDRSIRSIDAMGRGVPIDPFVDARPSKSRSVSRARCIRRRRIRIHRSRLSLDGIAEDDDRGRRVGDDARMTSSASQHHPAPPPGRVMTHRMVVVMNRMTHRMMTSCPR